MKAIVLSIACCLLLAIGLQAGSKKCPKSNGEITTQTRQIDAINEVQLLGSLDVVLVQSQESKVVVEISSNLIDLVETKQEGQRLSIQSKKCFYNKHKALVTVYTNSIESLGVRGSGTIDSDDTWKSSSIKLQVSGSGDLDLKFEADRCDISVTGSGDIVAIGKCQQADLTVTGSGDIKARTLRCAQAEAQVTGSGDIVLHVDQELEAKVTGSGDIVYLGQPAHVNSKVSGSGEIKNKM